MSRRISVKSTKMLWGRAAGRCSIPDCRVQLVMDESETDDPTLIGEECHIVASSLDGPRGRSDLPIERRDRYGNLILLCRNHHKVIDDNPLIYNVQKLHEIKQSHETWVRQNDEQYNEAKQRDEEYYASILERWERDCEVDNWEAWASWVLSGGGPQIHAELYDSLFEFRRWIFSRVWPKRYKNIERAFLNFFYVLQDFQNEFDEQKESRNCSDTLRTRKFYKIKEWDPELYYKLLNEYEDYVGLIGDLMLELSRSANWICDEVRRNLLPSYRLTEGWIVIQYGPTLDMKTHWRIPRYSEDELKHEIPYLGLEAFKSDRLSRDVHFGPADPAKENEEFLANLSRIPKR